MNEVINIKGTRHGLLILVDPNSDFEEIKHNLYKKMEAARGFFKGAKFAFSQEDNDQTKILGEICQQYGLIYQPDIKAKINSSPVGLPEKSVEQSQVSQVNTSDDTAGNTLLVKRSMRSGQQINYPGNIVVLGDVHAGAEIVAYGNVLVMGSCRGVVHAGANGNNWARVIAHRLCPAQLRISTSIACAPSDAQADYPEIAYLAQDNQIIVECYNSSRPVGRIA